MRSEGTLNLHHKAVDLPVPRGNDLSLLAGITEGTDGRRFVLLHVVDFRLELDLPRFHPLKCFHNPV